MLTANNVPSIKASKPSDILEITKLLPTRLHLFSNCFIIDLAAIATLTCYNIPSSTGSASSMLAVSN